MYKPASEAEYLKDLDDIFPDDIENGASSCRGPVDDCGSGCRTLLCLHHVACLTERLHHAVFAGIPKHLMRRHEEIVARHGRNDNGETVDSLIRKSFPSQSWSAPAAEEVDLSAGSAGAGAAH